MIYIAAPFFNKQQIERVEKVKSMLNKLGLKYFSPKDESNLLFKNDYKSSVDVFKLNVQKIKKCDFMICITNDKDPGTLFEAGLAYGLNKKIFYLYLKKGARFNLMLVNSGVASTSIIALDNAISSVLHGHFSYEELLRRKAQNADFLKS